MKKWELFSHDADIGIRGIGSTLNESFEMAACALTAVILDPAKIPRKKEIQIELQEQDIEFLFYDWINRIIYEMDTQRILFGHFEVAIIDLKLTAKIFGEEISNIAEDFGVDIKGATFTELKVITDYDSFVAQCVVDI